MVFSNRHVRSVLKKKTQLQEGRKWYSFCVGRGCTELYSQTKSFVPIFPY